MSTGKEKSVSSSKAKGKVSERIAFVQNLFRAGLYKRSQGRVTRQVTFAVIAITFGLLAWTIREWAEVGDSTMRAIVPALVLVAGIWTAFRIVNLPSFGDFLISVEAEMSKVSWPTRTELIRGSVVVLVTIIFLAGFLFLFDFIWNFVFTKLGVVGWLVM